MSKSRLLRRSEVEARVGLSRSSLYRAMSDGRFPRPVRLAARAVGWREIDIEDWIAHRPAADPAAARVGERGAGAGHSR